MKRRVWIGLAAALAFAVALGALGVSLVRLGHEYRSPLYDLYESIEVGMSEAEVRSVLGEPDHEYDGDNAPADYYVDGYSYRERPIVGKVLIYVGGEPIAYVYFDESGRVEEVFVGGS